MTNCPHRWYIQDPIQDRCGLCDAIRVRVKPFGLGTSLTDPAGEVSCQQEHSRKDRCDGSHWGPGYPHLCMRGARGQICGSPVISIFYSACDHGPI